MKKMEDSLHSLSDCENSFDSPQISVKLPDEVKWNDVGNDMNSSSTDGTVSCTGDKKGRNRAWNHQSSSFYDSNSNCLTDTEQQEKSKNTEDTDLSDASSVQRRNDHFKLMNDSATFSELDTSDQEQQAASKQFTQSTQTDYMNEQFQEDESDCMSQKNEHNARKSSVSTLSAQCQKPDCAKQNAWHFQGSDNPTFMTSHSNGNPKQNESQAWCQSESLVNKTSQDKCGRSSMVKGYSGLSMNVLYPRSADGIVDSGKNEPGINPSSEVPKQYNFINPCNNEEVFIKLEPDPDDLEYGQAKQPGNVEEDPSVGRGDYDGDGQDNEFTQSHHQSLTDGGTEDFSNENACLLTTFKVECTDEQCSEVDGSSKYQIYSVKDIGALYPVGNAFTLRNSVSTPENGIDGDVSDLEDTDDPSYVPSSGGGEEARLSKHLVFEIIGSNNSEESSGTCTCNYCSKDFSQPDDLVKHMAEHTEKTEDNKYKCKICSKLFKRKSAASLHAMIHLDNKHFPCAMCPKVFRTRRSLLTHIQCHSEQKVEIICKVCSSTFKSRKALKKHIVSEHDNLKFTCKRCYIQFTDEKTLSDHLCEKKPVKIYVCTVCSKSFNRGLSLKEHMWIHSDETKYHKPFICEECPMCFRKKSHLVEHRRTHTGEKPFVCTSCPKAFSSKNALKRHLVIHTGEKPLLCDVCSRSFGSLGDFNVHKKIHTGEKPHSCHICSKKFRRKGDLNEHMRTHTGEKPYTCKICAKSYRRSQHLTDHIRTHSGEKPYKCVVCTKAFITSKELKRHTLTHTQSQNVQSLSSEKLQAILSGQISVESLQAALNTENGLYNTDLLYSLQNEKPFQCETCCKTYRTQNALNRHNCSMQVEEEGEVDCSICSKTCSSSKALKRHMRSHKYEKDVICSRCSETFPTRADLSEHIKTHIGKRAYSCDVCSRTFKRASHLKEHLNIHTGEKPYICDICSMAFRRKGGLTEHQKSHAGKQPFTCDVCLKSFTRKDRMQKHFRQFHGLKTSWKCNICLDEFQQLSDLKQHKRNHLDNEISEVRHVEILERNPTDLEMLQDGSFSESEEEECEMSDTQQPDDDGDPDWESDNSIHSETNESDEQLNKSETSQHDDCFDNSDANIIDSEIENIDMSEEEDSNSDCSEDIPVRCEQPSDEKYK